MNLPIKRWAAQLLFAAWFVSNPLACLQAQDPVPEDLPPGVRAVWSLDKAFSESTTTRGRVSLNGLWRWQPAADSSYVVPSKDWGHLKVPGSWPGITDYMQKDCQTIFAHPAWKNVKLGEVTSAWYQREFQVPAEWQGRRIAVSMECLNSFAVVWIDGQKAGEARFPAGEVDITGFCPPGAKHLLTLQVTAMPLKGVMMSYGDTFGAKQVKGRVERRGLCGDVWLTGTPRGPRIENARITTSVRNWQIAFDADLNGLDDTRDYSLRADVLNGTQIVKSITSKSFKAAELRGRRFTFGENWKPGKLWDTHTPGNTYQARLTLTEGGNKVCDSSWPERFGFREFWIDGRDFYLNGSRIFLCAVPLDNAQIGAAWATYEGARESLQRLKSFGVNFVYTHNYGCEPGTHLSFTEVLKAADDEGVLVSFSQPHFGQYDWKGPDADRTNGYATHAAFYVRAAQNHPAVVFYSMSHNATGTEESMNPEMIDGIADVRNQWSGNNVRLARRAEAIVNSLDPSRIVYHHSSGNLGSMHTANFYANFAPVQEMSDWLEHWGTVGVKPLFLCEYGVPISWDWMMYRGWYKGVREFGSARVPWELCIAEWNAQFFGDAAYQLTDVEKECLRWEARQFRAGQVWHRWDYPRNAVESTDIEQRNAIFATYLTDNLRAFRTWGISAFCPWDHGIFWKLRDSMKRARKELKVDWDSLQRPGFSADYVDDQMAWMNTSFDRTDWIPTVAAKAIYRNNLPLLAYIAGKSAAFTSKDHNFYPGDTVEKQLIIINNSRQTVSADCSWSLSLPGRLTGNKKVTVETGKQGRVPVTLSLPPDAKPGMYELSARIQFGNGEVQEDVFRVDVLAKPDAGPAVAKVALFDPKGQTRKLLEELGIQTSEVTADSDLSGVEVLLVGKEALDTNSPAPGITRVREGLRVVIFEQSGAVLEKRFGFRIAEYGFRNVFERIPDHPVLAGLKPQNLCDWHGEATLVPPRLEYKIGSRHAPEVKWCDIPVTRLWRAGNRGNVASVSIEKPARGDFMPILDGGFSLQFSPLLQYREGKGLIIFCQLDVTGRTEKDPSAEVLVRNLINFARSWQPAPQRQLLYAGTAEGKRHLELAGFSPEPFASAKLDPGHILAVGPEGEKEVAPAATAIARFVQAGGRVLVAGLGTEAHEFLPLKFGVRRAEHISSFFEPPGVGSLFCGLSPAEVHNRDPRVLPLISSGATPLGDGVLAQGHDSNIVFCQMAPWLFGGSEQNNLRRTFRRTSFALSRVLCNLGASSSTPLLERFQRPAQQTETRWRVGFYLDKPQEWDDPYRFFCW